MKYMSLLLDIDSVQFKFNSKNVFQQQQKCLI